MPTKRLIPVTSLAVVLELGILLKRKRSKTRPEEGAQHHDREQEGHAHREVLDLHELGEGVRRDVGLRAVGEVEDPGGLVRQDQADGDDGVGAPVGDSGDGETQEVLHPPSTPYRFGLTPSRITRPACRPAA